MNYRSFAIPTMQHIWDGQAKLHSSNKATTAQLVLSLNNSY